MDLALYTRVLWRFRLVVLPGFLVAVALAVLAYGKVDPAHGFAITPRSTPTYRADGLLLITQPGFPWGNSQQQYLPGDVSKGLPPIPVGDFSRMSGIAMIYSELADSDEVRSLVRRRPGKLEKVVTSPYAPASAPPGTVLPMVALSADAATPTRAAQLVNARIVGFQGYIERRQEDALVPAQRRVVVQVLKHGEADNAIVVAGAKKTLPMVVFLAVMMLVCGLAFILENVRPRIRPVELRRSA
jgi:hypothetical protein